MTAADVPAARTKEGMIICIMLPYPPEGRSLHSSEKRSMHKMARKKEGTEIKKRAPARRTISPAVSFFSAAQIPVGMPVTSTQPMAHTAR